jgi:FkbM family methyltransferase
MNTFKKTETGSKKTRDPVSAQRHTIGAVLANIGTWGWKPGSIIDIGIAKGTDGLYDTWPDATICLVEPSPQSLPYMQKIAKQYPDVRIYNVGASDKSGEAYGTQHDTRPIATLGKAKPKWSPMTFKIMTCDEIVKDAQLKPPFVYKLDTDTHDREVLAGSTETLKQTDICIVEVKIYNGQSGWITPDDVWRLMHDNGLVFFDIAGILLGELGVLRTVDLVFVRENSDLFKRAIEHSGKKYSPEEVLNRKKKLNL